MPTGAALLPRQGPVPRCHGDRGPVARCAIALAHHVAGLSRDGVRSGWKNWQGEPAERVIAVLGYALRQVVVAPDLDALRGPLHGRRQLPLQLDSSAQPFSDFGSRRDRAQAYQLVLLEAADPTDLEQWLERVELLRLWPELYLPRTVRAAWQTEHPILARIGAGPHVPQL